MMELQLATDAQKVQRDHLTFPEWGTRLTLSQYLEREQRLRGHPWSRAAMRSWLLVEGGEVLASCESFKMRSYVGPATARRSGVTEGIASVYTEPHMRKRGYARAMMQRLVGRFHSEGALASLLYSDVGEAPYARAGYLARPALERVFQPEAGRPENAVDRTFGERDFQAELAQAPVPDDAFLVWPDALQLDWHLERERAYAALLGGVRPTVHGAAAGTGRIFWAGDLKNTRLVILTLAATRADEAVALLQAARRAAHGAGLREVVLWECRWPFTFPAGAGGERRTRSESIPMLCPLAPGISAGDWGQTSRGTWI